MPVSKLTPPPSARAVPIYQTTSYGFDNSEHAANLFGVQTIWQHLYTYHESYDRCDEQRMDARIGRWRRSIGHFIGQASQFLALNNILKSGDNFVSTSFLYGGTYNQFKVSFKRLGIEVRFAEPVTMLKIFQKIDKITKAIYLETIGNPRLNIPDFEKFAELAKDMTCP